MVFSMRNDGVIYNPSFSNINFPSFFNVDFVLGCDDPTYKPSYGGELSLLTNLIFRLNPTWARFFWKSSRPVVKKHTVSQKVFVHFTFYCIDNMEKVLIKKLKNATVVIIWWRHHESHVLNFLKFIRNWCISSYYKRNLVGNFIFFV